jgi:hypothetical protein
MASAKQILSSVFGVKSLTPSDPGIQKLAQLRSGVYPGVGNVTITPQAEVSQLLGLTPDPLAQLVRAGGLDPNPFLDKTLPSILLAGTAAVAGFGLGGVPGTIASKAIETTPSLTGGSKMSFADGTDSSVFSFGDIFSGINQALQGGLGQQLLNIGGTAATSYLTGSGPFTNLAAVPGGARAVAAVPMAGSAVATVGRSFFNRFPNLATAIQGWRNQGKNVTRSKLYSLMKRFGPDFLVTGGILTAAAVSELAMAGPGRRRMNAGNVKALRRAHRRMKSFHHICASNDTLLHHRKRRAAPQNFGGTRITQVK